MLQYFWVGKKLSLSNFHMQPKTGDPNTPPDHQIDHQIHHNHDHYHDDDDDGESNAGQGFVVLRLSAIAQSSAA